MELFYNILLTFGRRLQENESSPPSPPAGGEGEAKVVRKMFKKYFKARQKILKFLGAHAEYNAFIHVLSGIGMGILITYPLIGEHPIRWAVVFLTVGVLGHLYPLVAGK